MLKKNSSTSLTLACTLFFSLSTAAQKLPNVQKASVWAPQNIKIDGKATEWADKYQSYNNATDIYYTIANDDQNLYLILKVKATSVISGKILADGISFTVNHTISKKQATGVNITYPLLHNKQLVAGIFYDVAGIGTETSSGNNNSLDRLNKTFTENSKYIGIKGVKGIVENEISIYNTLNIQAASAFHAPAIYIYELAIPLVLLALPEGETKSFSYNIKLNPSKKFADEVRNWAPSTHSNLPPPPPPDPAFITATDFWGEYTLAKKL